MLPRKNIDEPNVNNRVSSYPKGSPKGSPKGYPKGYPKGSPKGYPKGYPWAPLRTPTHIYVK